MKVCVLQPDYSTTDVDYKNYDPPRYLTSLLPGDIVDHVFLNKLTTYRQLKELRKKNYDIFVNLCEGYLEWSVPSIDVIHSLEMLNLPYTGPTPSLYDPPKELMKYVAYTCGVNTPPYVLVRNLDQLNEVTAKLSFPLFIKPAKAGDSLGIDDDSLAHNKEGLKKKLSRLLEEYQEILVEEYIAGREFTVLVAADAGKRNCTAYDPIEFVFPPGKKFKTYALKTSELHEECNLPCKDEQLCSQLKENASRIFRAFEGVGYARMDFRADKNNTIYFLEINFTCSVFYENGYEGSADYVLMHDPAGKQGFLNKIIQEGIYRHALKQKKYVVKGNSLSGYGIYATKNLEPGEIIFATEEKPHRLVTKKFVEKNWDEEERENFRRYAWPVSSEVYIIWDKSPSEWSPQNHSCDPNTEYSGLNVVATKYIPAGEELTLDYTSFLNNEMESFICNCGAESCKKVIQGIESNSITYREIKRP
ncbi:MAG TPA: SET domain-containing protein-lysine N-methyltransferase [Chitinophagaceae bacterium]|nr:SET domain-containing protein-lysine N-methyltransferase [Chitinophagaceae bacterium]